MSSAMFTPLPETAVEAAAPDVTARGRAEAVVAKLAARPGLSTLAADGSFLDRLADFIERLAPLIIGCFGGAAGAAKEMRNPRLLTRVRLRQEVREELGTRDAFRLMGDPLVDAILAVGRETTAAELAALSA